MLKQFYFGLIVFLSFRAVTSIFRWAESLTLLTRRRNSRVDGLVRALESADDAVFNLSSSLGNEICDRTASGSKGGNPILSLPLMLNVFQRECFGVGRQEITPELVFR
jgi:hypothetical protein